MNLKTLESFYQATARSRSRLDSFVVMPDGQIGEPLTILNLRDMGKRGLDNGIFAVVSGSFNPLHDAHKAIYEKAGNTYGNRKVSRVFEISINRRGKDPLSLEDLATRLKQFEWYAPVWVTNACYFFEKTGLVSNWIRPSFQIGFDTAKRLIEDHGISGVQGIEANFMITPRIINEKLCGINDLIELYGACPNNMEECPIAVDPALAALSSTNLRNGTK